MSASLDAAASSVATNAGSGDTDTNTGEGGGAHPANDTHDQTENLPPSSGTVWASDTIMDPVPGLPLSMDARHAILVGPNHERPAEGQTRPNILLTFPSLAASCNGGHN
ncbi:hypothetical protein FS842_001097 [Serendipita sp. 407]|nr:hypothetical protein FS842_001097 [Serendipita sp. 407]